MGCLDVNVIEVILHSVFIHTSNQSIICFLLKLVVITAKTKAPFQDILERQLLKPVMNLLKIKENQSDININLIMIIVELVSMDNLDLKKIIN